MPIGEVAFGHVGIGRAEDGADLLQADAVFVQCAGIELDADAGKSAASHAHLPDAANLRQFLGHDGGRRVVDLAFAQHVGGEGDHEDGRVGRIHLAVGRVIGKVGGQVAASGGDGGLDVARGGIDVAIQVEL